jgi:hypothetical protein
MISPENPLDGQLILAHDRSLTALIRRCQSPLEERIEALEERNRKWTEDVKAKIALLLERVGGLESREPKWMETLEATHKKQIERIEEAVKAENAALRERVDGLERREMIHLPPFGPGVLGFLKQSNHIVRITVSSHFLGCADTLLTEDHCGWLSDRMPNPWIQWTITGGLKATVSSVKIRGLVAVPGLANSGVTEFVIKGSNDNAVWTSIIDSKSCPMIFENWVTWAEAIPRPPRPFSMIRVRQTGPRYCPECPGDHYLQMGIKPCPCRKPCPYV